MSEWEGEGEGEGEHTEHEARDEGHEPVSAAAVGEHANVVVDVGRESLDVAERVAAAVDVESRSHVGPVNPETQLSPFTFTFTWGYHIHISAL